MAKNVRISDMEPLTRARAQSLIGQLVQECAKKGYAFSVDAQDAGAFTIAIGPDRFAFELTEELDTVDEVPVEQAAAAKYDWQRLHPVRVTKPSGRLHLQLVTYREPTSWADRRRWTLEDKVPKVFTELASRAAAAQTRRDAEDHVHREKLARWQEAVAHAREECRQERARARAREQAGRWAQARDLRGYADALRNHPMHRSSAETLRWADIIQNEADRLDPLRHSPESLPPPLEEEIATTELNRFMPDGMRAERPPQPRQSSW